MDNNNLNHIVNQFEIQGTPSGISPLGEGLINDTYRVTTIEENAPDYVLQRINHHVFPDVEMVMNNIVAVTTHIREKLEKEGGTDIERRVLQFFPTKKNPSEHYTFIDENYWRIMAFIPDTISKEEVNPESSYAAGIAFGKFQSMLADIPVSLKETIANFHNMEFRLKQLREMVVENPVGRANEPEVQKLLREIESRAVEMCKAERMGREGILPKRICHCDTKVNNILFDQNNQVLCVIDLDTVMPNFIFSDYGDFLRSAANTVAEDCPEMEKVSFRMDIFRAFTEGYLKNASPFLLPVEIENLPYAAALFPYMQCVRFLWDYLNGDKYWKCQYPTHNFVRANNQFHLLLSIEKHIEEMNEIVKQSASIH